MTVHRSFLLAFSAAVVAFAASAGGACTSPMRFTARGLSGSAGSGGAGGAPACAPGEQVACYDGPAGTEGQGICKSGTQVCNADGMSYGPCEAQILPAVEDCATPGDENCDGLASGCGGVLVWARRFGGISADRGQAVTADAAGNVLVAGVFYGAIDFGGGILSAKGGGIVQGSDVFVAKLDPDGKHLFSKQFGDEYSQGAYAIGLDGKGDIGIAGSFAGTIDFGGGALPAADGEADLFVAKLGGSDGAHLWSRSLKGEPGSPPGYSVVFGPSGSLVVAGAFAQTIDMGSGPLASAGATDVFVTALEGETGAPLWGKTFGSTGHQGAYAVAADADGDILLTGGFEGTLDFGGGALSSKGGQDIFVAKLEGATGAHLWSRQFGGTEEDRAYGVAVDPNGDVVVAGVAGAGSADVFVAKLSSTGEELWSKSLGDGAAQGASAVGTDAAGNILLTGSFGGALDFGDGGKLSSAGDLDLFVAKLDTNGSHLWSRRYGDGDPQEATSLFVAATEDVYVTGALWGSMDVGPEILTSAGLYDVILMKLGD